MKRYFIISRMVKHSTIGILLLMTIILFSCSDSPNQFKYAGGTFNFAMENEPSTLIPRKVSDVYSARILGQIYEGLVSLNSQTLQPEPCLAKSWTISDDGKTIQFILREDVYFQTTKEFQEKVPFTAEDVVFSIERACTPVDHKKGYAYSSIYEGILKGAKEFFDGKTDHISGVKIKNNGKVIELDLLQRDANFINKLAVINAAVICKEAVKSGLSHDLIGTGPFKFSGKYEIDGIENIVLVKNENYYEKDENGNQLPYLDSLVFKIESRKLRQLQMFKKDEIQLIDGLPPSRITMILKENIEAFNGTPPKLILIRKPLLGTQYYSFNLLKEEFQDVRVRKAINYAINRKYIVQNILNNQAFGIGDGGIVPPAAFKGYNSDAVQENSYTFQPKKAKRLMAEAGYPNGKGFPTIDLKFNIGTIHSAVADEVAQQLKSVLNINMNLDGMTFKDLLQSQFLAKGDIFRTSWYADYYSPESFLLKGYGKLVPEDPSKPSRTNTGRYINPQFDKLFEKAVHSTSIIDRYTYFAKAEAVLMDDAPFIILWYAETIKIVPSYIRNLHFNEMNLYSFKNVYFKEWTKEEWQKKHRRK